MEMLLETTTSSSLSLIVPIPVLSAIVAPLALERVTLKVSSGSAISESSVVSTEIVASVSPAGIATVAESGV